MSKNLCVFVLLTMVLMTGQIFAKSGFSEDLDIGSMIQPLSEKGVFKVPGYSCWGAQITKGEDGKYYLIYSRWKGSIKNWLTSAEVAIAVSDQVDGPYKHVKVLLQGRGSGHWDELMVCNPKLKKFNGKYYLYYIASRQAPSRGAIRNSQRIGVAVSKSILGPYKRMDKPLVEPQVPIYNLAVNPAVEQMPDGRYLMIIKGDKQPYRSQRIQALAMGDSPVGPFKILPNLAIEDIDTEDASLWYDTKRKKFFAVFHAHKYIGLIESLDGIHWKRAKHYLITKNQLKRTDGTWLKTRAPLQRPSVYIENGEPRALCIAVPAPGDWHCVIVPLKKKESDQ